MRKVSMHGEDGAKRMRSREKEKGMKGESNLGKLEKKDFN